MGELNDRLVAELVDVVRQQLRKESEGRLRDVYLILALAFYLVP